MRLPPHQSDQDFSDEEEDDIQAEQDEQGVVDVEGYSGESLQCGRIEDEDFDQPEQDEQQEQEDEETEQEVTRAAPVLAARP